jgi:hypothetical protein
MVPAANSMRDDGGTRPGFLPVEVPASFAARAGTAYVVSKAGLKVRVAQYLPCGSGGDDDAARTPRLAERDRRER